jgi:hypothetical protein
MNDYLAKPVRLALLKERFRQYLQMSDGVNMNKTGIEAFRFRLDGCTHTPCFIDLSLSLISAKTITCQIFEEIETPQQEMTITFLQSLLVYQDIRLKVFTRLEEERGIHGPPNRANSQSPPQSPSTSFRDASMVSSASSLTLPQLSLIGHYSLVASIL